MALSLAGVGYGCGGEEEETSASTCENLCDKAWNDCSGLRGANYWFGTSYNNCIQRCPTFLNKLERDTRYGEREKQSVDCVINSKDCEELKRDHCGMDEGDLFLKAELYYQCEDCIAEGKDCEWYSEGNYSCF